MAPLECGEVVFDGLDYSLCKLRRMHPKVAIIVN